MADDSGGGVRDSKSADSVPHQLIRAACHTFSFALLRLLRIQLRGHLRIRLRQLYTPQQSFCTPRSGQLWHFERVWSRLLVYARMCGLGRHTRRVARPRAACQSPGFAWRLVHLGP